MRIVNHFCRIAGFLGIIILVASVFISCEKFEGNQTVPSYIQLDSFQLINNPNVELGVLTENFTDVWVYADDQLIGAFELPTFHIPILLEGAHKLTLYPGIKYNGISGTRGPNLFIEPAEYENFNLIIDSVIKIDPPEVMYFSSTVLSWSEEFETSLISLKPTTNSDTSLQFYPYNPFHPLYGNASGVAYLTDENPVLEVTSENDDEPFGFELPSNSAPVVLEIDYNTNNSFIVGLIITEVNIQITQHPVVVVNPSGGVWKKIYVNFTPTVNDNSNADYYKVFIRADKSSDVNEATLLFDNIKLIYKDFS
jgi:hypothetical protein